MIDRAMPDQHVQCQLWLLAVTVVAVLALPGGARGQESCAFFLDPTSTTPPTQDGAYLVGDTLTLQLALWIGSNHSATQISIASVSHALDCFDDGFLEMCEDEGPKIGYAGDATLSTTCTFTDAKGVQLPVTVTSDNPDGGVLPNILTFTFSPAMEMPVNSGCELTFDVTILEPPDADQFPQYIEAASSCWGMCDNGLLGEANATIAFEVLYCGDDIVNAPGETCDGSAAGENPCRDDCTYCGDGIVDPAEDCDLGDLNGVPGSLCLSDCTQIFCISDAACDDGLSCNGAERCDPPTGCQPGLPPCGGAPCDEATGACELAFEFVCRVVTELGGEDEVDLLLPGEATVLVGSNLYVEFWARDVATAAGIVSAYADLDYLDDCVQAGAIEDSLLFSLFPGGADAGGFIDELGGSQLAPGVGLAPQWARVATVQFDAVSECAAAVFQLSAAEAESSAFGLGVIPAQSIDHGACQVAIQHPCSAVQDCADRDGDGIRDEACVWWTCEDGGCTATGVGYADLGGSLGSCPPDGVADGNDFFHAINCFSNQSTTGVPGEDYPCEAASPVAYNVDAAGLEAPCDPDGVCDGNDAFAAINAFEGTATCSCPAGVPAPSEPHGTDGGDSSDGAAGRNSGDLPQAIAGWGPRVVEETALRLVANRADPGPGELVEVDVFLGGAVSDLRGYQLHLGVRGGVRGSLTLVDIVAHERSGRVFRGLSSWQAFNVHTAQMLAGLHQHGITTSRPAYLATFVYRVDDGAAGDFVIELLAEPANRAHRTALFSTPAGGHIRIGETAAVRLTVRAPEHLRRRHP